MEQSLGIGGDLGHLFRAGQCAARRVGRRGTLAAFVGAGHAVTHLPALHGTCGCGDPVEPTSDFVASEALAGVEDEESEEDVLVLSKSFNLLELIEDELLMATPLVPKHAVCPKPVKLLSRRPGIYRVKEQEKPNPFAVLQQFKKKIAD